MMHTCKRARVLLIHAYTYLTEFNELFTVYGMFVRFLLDKFFIELFAMKILYSDFWMDNLQVLVTYITQTY